MIKAKPIEEIKPFLFEWDEECKFLIRFRNRRQIDKIRKKSSRSSYFRGEKKEEHDAYRFGELFTTDAIAGWEKLTYRKLTEMCCPLKLDPDAKMEDEIKFTEEHLEYLVSNMTVEFQNFIWKASNSYNSMQADLLKN